MKAVNDKNFDESFFADPGQTRKLLSYYISPSDLTPDQQAIRYVSQQFVEDFEAEDLDGAMSLFSDDYLDSCMDKASVRSYFETLFAENDELLWLSSPGEVVVQGDSAYHVRERVRTGVDVSTGKRWWDWNRKKVYWRKEGGEWKGYGNQANFDPSFWISVRNEAAHGEYWGFWVGIYDCAGEKE